MIYCVLKVIIINREENGEQEQKRRLLIENVVREK